MSDTFFIDNSNVEKIIEGDHVVATVNINNGTNRPDKIYALRHNNRFPIAFAIGILLTFVTYFHFLYVLNSHNFIELGWTLSFFMALVYTGVWLDKPSSYMYIYNNLPNKAFCSNGDNYDFDLLEEMEPPFYKSFVFASKLRYKHFLNFKSNGIQTQLNFIRKEDATDMYQRWLSYKALYK